jgi:hypothetical protein|tara:strand:- start:1010 stop:1303 length:294 start_codon:yes stop_codon:yes gene_type:complete
MNTPELGMSDDFKVEVVTTQNRGHTPEEVAELCINKIVGISTTADPIIRQQAEAFKTQIKQVIIHYMKQAIQSDRTTVYNALLDAGEPKLADLIRIL